MVTKPAITTMKQAIRTLLGMIFRRAAITMLEQVRIRTTAMPMPMPLNREVVMASRGHIPISWTRAGFWVIRPSFNCFLKFILLLPP